MKIFDFLKKKNTNDAQDEIEIKGAEVVHDSGLTDQESTDTKANAAFKDQALKDKDQNPYKTVHSVSE